VGDIYEIDTDSISKQQFSVYLQTILLVGLVVMQFIVIYSLLANNFAVTIIYIIILVAFTTIFSLFAHLKSLEFINNKLVLEAHIYDYQSNCFWNGYIYCDLLEKTYKLSQIKDMLSLRNLKKVMTEVQKSRYDFEKEKSEIDNILKKMNPDNPELMCFEYKVVPFNLNKDYENIKKVILISEKPLSEHSDILISRFGKYEKVHATLVTLILKTIVTLKDSNDKNKIQYVPILQVVANDLLLAEKHQSQIASISDINNIILLQYDTMLSKLLAEINTLKKQLTLEQSIRINEIEYAEKIFAKLSRIEQETSSFPLLSTKSKAKQVVKQIANASIKLFAIAFIIIMLYFFVFSFIL